MTRKVQSRSADLAFHLGEYWDLENAEDQQHIQGNDKGHKRGAYLAASRAMRNLVMDYWKKEVAAKGEKRGNEIRHMIEKQFLP